MLSSGQKTTLDKIKVDINRVFSYERTDGAGGDEADLTLDFDDGKPNIRGYAQTIDELEYATAKLITAFRKEVSHGKVQPDKTLAWKA